MAHRSPTAEGFRTIIRTPSLWLAEVAWRWAVTISAGLLLLLGLSTVLDSVRVSGADQLYMHSGSTALLSSALADVLRNATPRLLKLSTVLVPAWTVLWVFASAMGRAATLSIIVPNSRVRIGALLGLSFLRAALLLSVVAGVVGAAMLPGVFPGSASQFAAVFLLLACISVWGVLNRLLSLAAIPAAEGCDMLTAIASASRLARKRARAFAVAGAWFGLLHLVTAAGAFLAALFAMSVLSISGPAGLIVLAVVIVGYSSLVDFFHIARVAAYAAIARGDGPPTEAIPVPPEPFPNLPTASSIPEATA